MHAIELHPRRFYKNHFEDSVRQCCLDLMLGNRLLEVELQDCWTYLCIAGHIASELLPKDPPSYIPHSSLAPEFELANALYYMSRSVLFLLSDLISLKSTVSRLSLCDFCDSFGD